MNSVDASNIVGGPGNPTVNTFVETYDRQAEMRVRSLRNKKLEPFIIGCDLSQGESMTGRIEYRKRQEETE